MSEKLHRADYVTLDVTEYSVLEITPASVVYFEQSRNGDVIRKTERLRANNHCWFKTRPQAVDWLRGRVESEIADGEKRVEYLKGKLGRIQ